MTPQDEAYIKALEEENDMMRRALRAFVLVEEQAKFMTFEEYGIRSEAVLEMARRALQKEPQS